MFSFWPVVNMTHNGLMINLLLDSPTCLRLRCGQTTARGPRIRPATGFHAVRPRDHLDILERPAESEII